MHFFSFYFISFSTTLWLFSCFFFFDLHLNSSEIALEWNPMAKWVQSTNIQSCFMQNMERQHKILFKWYNSVRLLLPHFSLSSVVILSFIHFFFFATMEFVFFSSIQLFLIRGNFYSALTFSERKREMRTLWQVTWLLWIIVVDF